MRGEATKVRLFFYALMKPPVLYQLNGMLPANKYLLGQYRWPYAVRITGALLQVGQPPSGGALELHLEVGGVDQGRIFTVGAEIRPAVPLVQEARELSVAVAANTWVRIQGIFNASPEESAGYLSVTLTSGAQSVTDVALSRPTLQVGWVNGEERLILFDYDAASHTFTPTLFGALGVGSPTVKASLLAVGTTSLSFYIRGVEVFRVAAGKVTVGILTEGATGGPSSPRLEFLVDGVRVGSVDSAGQLSVAALEENTPPTWTPSDEEFYERFLFYSGGVVTGQINAQGLLAEEVEEAL